MSILTLVEEPVSEQIAAIERGFPSQSLNQIVKVLGIPKVRIIAGLRLTPRTISAREKAGTRFNPVESERLLRVLRIRRLAGEIFTTDEAIAQWLNTPDRTLDQRTPLEMLTTDLGVAKVENLVQAMIHGVPV